MKAVMAEATNAEKANPQRFNDATVMSLIKKGIAQRVRLSHISTLSLLLMRDVLERFSISIHRCRP